MGMCEIMEETTAAGGHPHENRLTADRYSVVAIRAREIASLNASYQNERAPEVKTRLTGKVDSFLGYLVSQFRNTPSSTDVRWALRNDTIDPLNKDEIAGLSDGIIPIVVVRSLMRRHRLMVDIRGLQSWNQFRDRYEAPILNS